VINGFDQSSLRGGLIADTAGVFHPRSYASIEGGNPALSIFEIEQ
jgi:hypothetical protein